MLLAAQLGWPRATLAQMPPGAHFLGPHQGGHWQTGATTWHHIHQNASSGSGNSAGVYQHTFQHGAPFTPGTSAPTNHSAYQGTWFHGTWHTGTSNLNQGTVTRYGGPSSTGISHTVGVNSLTIRSNMAVADPPASGSAAAVALAEQEEEEPPPQSPAALLGRLQLQQQVEEEQQQIEIDEQVGTRTATDYTDPTSMLEFDIETRASNGWFKVLRLPQLRIEGGLHKNVLQGRAVYMQQGQAADQKFFKLDRGNMLFAPHQAMVVATPRANVYIDSHSIVWVMETGNETAVYNLHDRYTGSVRVVAGKKFVNLPPGKQLVLTSRSASGLDDINPAPQIMHKNPVRITLDPAMSVFAADFSMASALLHISPLRDLLKSDAPVDRKTAHALLKDAVILATLFEDL